MPSPATLLRLDPAVDSIIGVIEHYGFQSAQTENSRYPASPADFTDESPWPTTDNAARKMPHAPAMYYRIQSRELNSSKRRAPRQSGVRLQLRITGIEDGLAEAIMIHVGRSILHEIGAKKFAVSVNSMGDKDSAARFNKEFYMHVRRNISSFGPCCRGFFKSSIQNIFKCRRSECVEARANAPKPIDFLTENSRRHFKEVLEHLESLTMPYMINEWLIDDDHNFLKVYFSIESEDVPSISIRGGRHSATVRATQSKRENSLTGAIITLMDKSAHGLVRSVQSRSRKPKVFVVQLGCEARKIGLMALEGLRQAGISVVQNIDSVRLTDQIGFAEEHSIPYMIIIGHKEALEGAAILRNTESRSQKIVPIEDLPSLVRRPRVNGL